MPECPSAQVPEWLTSFHHDIKMFQVLLRIQLVDHTSDKWRVTSDKCECECECECECIGGLFIIWIRVLLMEASVKVENVVFSLERVPGALGEIEVLTESWSTQLKGHGVKSRGRQVVKEDLSLFPLDCDEVPLFMEGWCSRCRGRH